MCVSKYNHGFTRGYLLDDLAGRAAQENTHFPSASEKKLDLSGIPSVPTHRVGFEVTDEVLLDLPSAPTEILPEPLSTRDSMDEMLSDIPEVPSHSVPINQPENRSIDAHQHAKGLFGRYLQG